MANRFWVGGTATWNNTAGSKWSATSGGSGGQSVPSSSDDVFFDANSGSVTCSLSGSRSAKTINFTGFTGTFNFAAASSLNVSGNATFGTAMTVSLNGGELTFIANANLTSNGKILPRVGQGLVTGTLTLLDDLVCTSLALYRGNIDANDKNVTAEFVQFVANDTCELIMGSGTFELYGLSPWDFVFTGPATVTPESSTIKLTNTSNSDINFEGGDKSYGNLWLARGASTGGFIFTDNNSFADFKDDGTSAHTITFPNVTTLMNSFHVSGNPSQLITLERTGGSGTFGISIASGIISSDYLSISNSVASGGATFYAGANSTNGGGNTGWIFTALPAVRYWVGGNASWDDLISAKWALTSGGTGGAPVPTALDDVFMNAASGAVTVTKTGARECKDLTFTGFTGTFAGTGTLTIGGDLVLGSGMTWSSTGVDTMIGTAVSVTSSGKTMAGGLTYDSVAGTLTFIDDFSILLALTLTNGTIDANDQDVTVGSFSSSNANARTLTMGSGLWTLIGAGTVWDTGSTGSLTFNKDTANIKLTNNSASSKTFAGGSLTFNDLWIAIAGAGSMIMQGSNIFDDLKIDNAIDTKFTDGTTTTITSLTAGVGTQRALRGTGAGGWIISCTSGTISVSNCDISYSTAVGGATFEAFGINGNTNGGNNSGWIFSFAPIPIAVTGAISAITKTTATAGGEITSDGGEMITERGFVWDTSPSPTTLNSKVIVAGELGIYIGALTGLSPGTTYYVRAYASNIAGTGYGSNVVFETLSDQTRVGALDSGFTDFGEPIYFEMIDRWRNYTELYANVQNISGINVYSENAAGARLYFQAQKSPPNAWEDIDVVTQQNNALFPNANTQDFEVGRLRIAGFSSGTPVVIHSIELLSIQNKGFDQN